MKLLHIAFLSGHTGNLQFLRKVNAQFRALKKQNPDTHCFVFGDNVANLNMTTFDFSYIDLRNIIFSSPAHRRLVLYRILAQLIRTLQPDIVYCRYPWADIHLYHLVREFPNFIFEHQTKETHELQFNLQKKILGQELAYGSKVLAHVAGIVAVSQDYLAYELQRAGGTEPKPGYTLGNGVDVEQVPLRLPPSLSDCIHILCLASFSKWHGYERLIHGLHLYNGNQNLHVHMVGTGPQLHHYQRLVTQYHLDNYFTFHGRLEPQSYQRIVAQCHIAVGALGLHRMNLHVTASLKNREYCAMGIPFAYAGQDSDFDSQLPFVNSLPATDEPIDIQHLLQFALKTQTILNIGSQMRDYATTHLSWDVKVKGLLSFFRTLTHSLPTPFQPPLVAINLEFLLKGLPHDSYVQQSPPVSRKLIQAAIHQEQGNNPAAQAIFMDILDHSDSPQKYLFRILVEMEKIAPHDEQQLRHYSEKILRLYTTKKRVDNVEMYRIASLYKKFGQLDTATQWFQKLLKKDPQEMTGGVYFHLGEIYIETGHPAQARNMFEHCLKEIPSHLKAAKYLQELT